MRHNKGNRKLSKPTDQRIAMIRSLALSLITHEKIKSTDARCQEAQKYVEKLITLGKKGTLHARRRALQLLPNKDAVKKVFDVLAKNYTERLGGYTRITKLGFQKGDNSPISQIEFV